MFIISVSAGTQAQGLIEITVAEVILGLHFCYPSFSYQNDLGLKGKVNYFLKTIKR